MYYTSLHYNRDTSCYMQLLYHLPHAIWLDSCAHANTSGRYDIISAEPLRTVQPGDDLGGLDPFVYTENTLSNLGWTVPGADAGLKNLPFSGGWLGYYGYETLPGQPHVGKPKGGMPDFLLGLYDWAVVIDHELQQTWLTAQASVSKERWQTLVQRFSAQALHEAGQELEARLTTYRPEPGEITCNMTEDVYHEKFDRVMEHLHVGDAYQVNLARCWSQDTLRNYDPFLHYCQLRKVNPAPYAGLFLTPQGAILSLSPELFIRAESHGRVVSQPIKGTIARGNTESEDLKQQKKLLSSEKDKAENVMIVDLVRNDLAKHCLPGSVRVEDFCALLPYPSVHHLVSTVVGQLESEHSVMELVRDAFPGGSITGAPKERVMAIISALEPHRRGPYCGSLGFLDSRGQAAWNILIRTLVHECRDNLLQCHGGGGLTLGSEVESEYEETAQKIRRLLGDRL